MQQLINQSEFTDPRTKVPVEPKLIFHMSPRTHWIIRTLRCFKHILEKTLLDKRSQSWKVIDAFTCTSVNRHGFFFIAILVCWCYNSCLLIDIDTVEEEEVVESAESGHEMKKKRHRSRSASRVLARCILHVFKHECKQSC